MPPYPSSGLAYGQNFGFFDALQRPSVDILQPVLALGVGPYPNSWTIFSEYNAGLVDYRSSFVSVNYKDLLKGTIVRYPSPYPPCSGVSASPGYTITATDVTTGGSSSLIICSSALYSEALTGALEAHNLGSCSQLPNTTSEAFNTISFTAANSYTLNYWTYSSHTCNASASWTFNYLTLYWNPNA